MIKKLICISAALLFFAQPVLAAEPKEYSKAEEIYRDQFEVSGVEGIYDSLPSETRDILGSMGLDPRTGELPELSHQNVFEHILSLFKGGLKRPFAVCTSVLGIVLIVSAVAALSECDAEILLTGGIAYGQKAVESISKWVDWIAPITVYPGEDELLALAQGALRVLRGEETAQVY